MEQLEPNFPIAQRKAIADLLRVGGDIRSQARNRYSEKHDALEEAAVSNIVQKKGLPEIATKIRKAKEQLEQWEKTIKDAGLHLDSDGSFEIHWGAKLQGEIDANIEKEIGTLSDIDKAFEKTILKVWTVKTLDEATKIVEPLLSQ